MNDRMFDSPVFVKNGNTLIQEIACLEDALEFLYEWPENRRSLNFDTALWASQRAFEGDYPSSAAREAFVGFATVLNVRTAHLNGTLERYAGFAKPGQ